MGEVASRAALNAAPYSPMTRRQSRGVKHIRIPAIAGLWRSVSIERLCQVVSLRSRASGSVNKLSNGPWKWFGLN